jgi:hypothetical protein
MPIADLGQPSINTNRTLSTYSLPYLAGVKAVNRKHETLRRSTAGGRRTIFKLRHMPGAVIFSRQAINAPIGQNTCERWV